MDLFGLEPACSSPKEGSTLTLEKLIELRDEFHKLYPRASLTDAIRFVDVPKLNFEPREPKRDGYTADTFAIRYAAMLGVMAPNHAVICNIVDDLINSDAMIIKRFYPHKTKSKRLKKKWLKQNREKYLYRY